VSFAIDDLAVNLVDAPGHPDFMAEVERVLSVLDGAVLVISAVAGVQAQTRVLMRALQRLHLPSLIFVNKIDRGGAEYERVIRNIRDKLAPAVIAMGTASELGSSTATNPSAARSRPGPGRITIRSTARSTFDDHVELGVVQVGVGHFGLDFS
jgi:ribosomal protection tetracycline resistance protein